MKNLTDVLMDLCTAFPAYTPLDAQKMLDLYTFKLKQYPVQDVQAAADYIIEHNKFFPSIKELIDATKAAHYEPENQVGTQITAEQKVREVNAETIYQGECIELQQLITDKKITNIMPLGAEDQRNYREKRKIINHEIYEPTEEDYAEWERSYETWKESYSLAMV